MPSSTRVRRRRPTLIASLIAVPCLGLIASGCSDDASGDASASGKSIKVGMVCGGMTPMAAQIAINDNSFPDDLEVEKFCFDSGSEGVQALVGGSLDAFMGSVEHVLSTRAQGLTTRAYAGINNQAPYSLVASTDGDIETVADLVGEKVGVTEPGSLSDTELHLAAEEEGIAYDDLQVIGAGSGSTMAAAISQDQVSAGMVSEPQRSQLIESGDYRLVWEPTTPYAAIVTVADSEWVADNEDTMRSFLEGLAAAADDAKSDPAAATESMLVEEFPVDEPVLRAAVESGLATIPDGLVVTEEVYDSTTGILVGVGVLEESEVAPYDEVFDLSLLPGQS